MPEIAAAAKPTTSVLTKWAAIHQNGKPNALVTISVPAIEPVLTATCPRRISRPNSPRWNGSLRRSTNCLIAPCTRPIDPHLSDHGCQGQDRCSNQRRKEERRPCERDRPHGEERSVVD
jgi:hypothetical protein